MNVIITCSLVWITDTHPVHTHCSDVVMCNSVCTSDRWWSYVRSWKHAVWVLKVSSHSWLLAWQRHWKWNKRLKRNSNNSTQQWVFFMSDKHHYDCVAPNVDISLQSGRFWATSVASFWGRGCWISGLDRIVFIHVVRGRPGGLLQPTTIWLKISNNGPLLDSIRKIYSYSTAPNRPTVCT